MMMMIQLAAAVRFGTRLTHPLSARWNMLCVLVSRLRLLLRLAQSQEEENGNYLKICLRLSLSVELCKTTNDQCSGWYRAPRQGNWRLVGGQISCHVFRRPQQEEEKEAGRALAGRLIYDWC